ncbi:MAG TPA: tetratricopeptide repeat protein [Oceanobacillus sp.]|nr:tetratricopeptide repeat protein [Oceanobacillus sp.]
MIERFRLFLGPARLRSIFFLIALTGLASLILNAVVDEYDWVRPVQTLLALAAVVGVLVIIGGRLEPEDRGRLAALLLPALGAITLGLTILPHLLLPLAGAAAGWIVAGLLLFRSRAPMEYQKAIRHLRKNEYEAAVKTMDGLIKAQPDDPNHYRFRAELLRLWGKLDRARRDYIRMTELDPNSAVGYNGLAEVSLQEGNHERAHEAAVRAAELAPDDWVALYNLGMIEDRLKQNAQAIEHLQQALELKVPDVRHRLLIHLYLARAYARTGEMERASEQLAAIKKHRSGLEEWQKILENEQAATLRSVLGSDVQAAQELVDGKLTLENLAES